MENEIVIPKNAGELVFNIPAMNQMQELANMMAGGKVAIPKEMQGNPGDCLAVCMQAALWKMNPFAVAQGSFFVGGKIGYEGKLINAAVTNSGAIEGRVKFEYIGDWSQVQGKFTVAKSTKGNSYNRPDWKPEDEEGLGVKIIATLSGEAEPSEYELFLNQCQPRNSTLWATNPKHQITYTGVRYWARVFCPEVILGVYSDDELEKEPMKEINPTPEEQGRSFANLAPAPVDPKEIIVKIEACTNIASLEKLSAKCAEFTKGSVDYKMVKAAYGKKLKELKKPIEEAPEADFLVPVEAILQMITGAESQADMDEVKPLINDYEGKPEHEELAAAFLDKKL